jgi:hypothetical protein
MASRRGAKPPSNYEIGSIVAREALIPDGRRIGKDGVGGFKTGGEEELRRP